MTRAGSGIAALIVWVAAGTGEARLRPGADADRTPPAQVTRLTLPFTGIWGVLQGFDSDETHRGYAAFALDFVPAQLAGTREPPRGAPLSRFACYGRPVLAPADGTVVAAANRGARLAGARPGKRRGQLRHPPARPTRVHRVPPPGGPVGHVEGRRPGAAWRSDRALRQLRQRRNAAPARRPALVGRSHRHAADGLQRLPGADPRRLASG